MNIKHGLGTKVLLAVSVLTLLPPVITQVVALVENVSTNWSSGEKTSLIAGAAAAAVIALGKFAQAVAAIIKGEKEV